MGKIFIQTDKTHHLGTFINYRNDTKKPLQFIEKLGNGPMRQSISNFIGGNGTTNINVT